jgi:hypothetical protein
MGTNWFSVLDIKNTFFSCTWIPNSSLFFSGRILRKEKGNNTPGQSYPEELKIILICLLGS